MAEKTLKAKIKLRRDTSANWENKNPILLNGEEIVVDTANGETRTKIGDGIKTYKQLPFSDEKLRSLIDAKANSTDLNKTVQYGHAFLHGTDWNKSLYNADIDDYFASARPRYNVSAIYYDMGTEEENAKSLTSAEIDRMFDGNYDSCFTIPKGKTLKITFNDFSMIYPYGFYMVRCFPMAAYVDKDNRWPTSVSCSIYSRNSTVNYTWKELFRRNLDGYSSDNTNERVAFYNYGTYNSSQLQFIIEGKADYQVGVTEIEMWSFRYSTTQKPFVSKYGPQKLYYELTAPSFKGDLNGTATKATADTDGNVISTTYDKKEATLLSSDLDLISVVNEGRYYATSGNTISNKPEGVDSFYLEVKKIKDAAILKYVLWEEDSGMPYTRNRLVNLTKNLTEDSRNLLDFKDTTGTVTNNGVTMTNNGDGTFTVNGTNSTNAYMAFVLDTFSFDKKGFYFLSGFPNRTANSNIYMQVLLKKGGTQVREAKDYGTGVTVLTDIDFNTMTLQVGIAPNATLNNVIIKPYFASWCSDWVKGATTADSIAVENSLNSDSTNNALSAAQGKILSEMCNSILTNTNQISKGNGFLAGGALTSSGGIAIGVEANTADNGIAIGEYSSSDKGVSIGKESYSSGQAGLALGNTARAEGKNSIQIGMGSNNEKDTFQVGNYQLLNPGGYIPKERIANKSITSDKIADNTFVSVEEGKSLIDENVASNLSYDNTDSVIKSEKDISLSSVVVQGPTGDQITYANTNKLTGDEITLKRVASVGETTMGSNSASYTSSGITIASPDGKTSPGFSVDGSGNLSIREIGNDNATKIHGGNINAIRLNNATIGDLSKVATNTTLVAIIEELQAKLSNISSVSTVSIPVGTWEEKTEADGSGTGIKYKYRKIVSEGLSSTKQSMIDIVYSSSVKVAKQEKEAFSLIDRIVVGDNYLELYCFEEAPTVPLNLKIVMILQQN